jgi:hypothetical protein
MSPIRSLRGSRLCGRTRERSTQCCWSAACSIRRSRGAPLARLALDRIRCCLRHGRRFVLRTILPSFGLVRIYSCSRSTPAPRVWRCGERGFTRGPGILGGRTACLVRLHGHRHPAIESLTACARRSCQRCRARCPVRAWCRSFRRFFVPAQTTVRVSRADALRSGRACRGLRDDAPRPRWGAVG